MTPFEFKRRCYNRSHTMPCSQCLSLIKARLSAPDDTSLEAFGDYYHDDVEYLLEVIMSLQRSVQAYVDDSWNTHPGGPS
jgi:hypothetical protein